MRRRFAFCVAFATCLISLSDQNKALAQDVYIGQMDGSTMRRPAGGASLPETGGSGGVYIRQVPPGAQPLPPPRVTHRSHAAQVGTRSAKRILPDVGTGVTLAVPASAQDHAFPSVGKGTVGS
jgi:hypothetical protein